MSTSAAAAWVDRPGLRAASPQDLAALLDREVDRVEGLLFTATPREDLDVIGRFQQAKDQAFAGQLRAIIASLVRTPVGQREFVADEVALALGVSAASGTMLVDLAGKAGELARVLRRLILTIDPVAARRRKKVADRKARVSTYTLPDGQGALYAVGPLEQIARIRAALDGATDTERARRLRRGLAR